MARFQDLTGKRFGKLTVLRKTDGKENRYYTWLCRCDCGNQIIVNTKRLSRGTIQDCGCTKIRGLGPKPADLTGKRFGRLVVLKQSSNNAGGRVCWLCRCDCGSAAVVTAHGLKSGKTKSCGCLKQESHATMRELTGQRFGNLTVLGISEERSYKGSILWNCQCGCGKKVVVAEDSLISGHYKSCGCGRIEQGKELQNYLTFVDGTCIEWLERRKHRSDNTSGCTGVYAAKKGTYRASITLCGKRYYLGTYSEFEKAVEARKYAEEVLHEGFVTEYRAWRQKADGNPKWVEDHPFEFEPETKTEDLKYYFRKYSDAEKSADDKRS